MRDRIRIRAYPGANWEQTAQSLTSESRLWVHAMERAVLDAGSRSDKHRLEVGKWLFSDDFDTVCDLANVNPDTMFELIKEVLLAKWPVSIIRANEVRRALLWDDPDLIITRGGSSG